MDSYPAIEDHGLIGDLQTAALVATDGTIDWFRAPRLDSPSILAALLDRQRGGHFRIGPEGTSYVTNQLCMPGTPAGAHRQRSGDPVAHRSGREPRICNQLPAERGGATLRV